MKGESNATAPNWFLCSRAEAQGDMCCTQPPPLLVLLLRPACVAQGAIACHSSRLCLNEGACTNC